jgi:hypothetical protein
MGAGGGCAGGVSAVTRALLVWALLLIAGCAPVQEDTSASTVSHMFAQPPQGAAACFARNAEAHSSALVAEIRPADARGHVEIVVRVKNGVTYATAELRPAGARARGTITLMAISLRGTGELVRSLVEGC